MVNRLLIFGGTTEGRELAEFLARTKTPCHVCVATEYGEELLEAGEYITVHAGRLDTEQMAGLIRRENITLVIDATHPYAVEVSANIRSACEHACCTYRRLLREKGAESQEGLVTVDSVEEAVAFLEHTQGNILAATGSKELHRFCALTNYRERVTARVLSTPEVARSCAELGFKGKNLICMQGPFTEELNYAMLLQVNASWLVTKDSGKTGGIEEKLRAASRAGARVVLVGRPPEEEGLTLDECKSLLCKELGLRPKRRVSLVGIGMGGRGQMTGAAIRACEEAQVLIGARRMLAEASQFGKPQFVSYLPKEIREFTDAHPEYERIAVLLSGDVGFYSGAKGLLNVFAGDETELYCGISSVVYFCSRLKIPWEDVRLTSVHGRSQNVIREVMANPKVFALIGKGEGVRTLCQKLLEYNLDHVTVYVGEELSYPDERIQSGRPSELIGREFSDLCVVLIEHEGARAVVTHGIPDEAFVRAKVPMTKEEIRDISLSRLRLYADSVIYDVGAGTGSVSVEMALMAGQGQVYAIEKKPEAAELIRENKRKFAADNLTVVEGSAPEALHELPAPTHAFIGGSSGNMKEILGLLLEKNPHIRVVINAIALETVAEVMHCLKELPLTDVEISAVSAARAKELGAYHLMMGQNPVYIVSFTGNAGEKDKS